MKIFESIKHALLIYHQEGLPGLIAHINNLKAQNQKLKQEIEAIKKRTEFWESMIKILQKSEK